MSGSESMRVNSYWFQVVFLGLEIKVFMSLGEKCFCRKK
jgi:hypothetical protein